MKHISNKLLLASSCLALALAVPLPLLGVEPEEKDGVSTPVVAATPVQEPIQEDSWKESLYAFPEIQAGFKMDVFNRLLLTPEFKDPTKQNELFRCLEQAAFERRNPKALEKVKQFSTKQVLGINRISSDKVKKADNLLKEFLISEQNAKLNGLSTGEFLYRMGVGYQEGSGVKKDPVQAAQYLFRSLELDQNTENLLALGVFYKDGSPSIPQDQRIARLLWKRAAADDHLDAFVSLATLYYDKKILKAAECWKKASEMGCLESTLNLATVYYKGENGVEKDHEQALKYFLRAFNSKEIGRKEKNKCATQIGLIYYDGFGGTPPDYKQALKFFLNIDTDYLAIFHSIIIDCYEKLKDQKKVFQWSLRAAEQDDPKALFNVGYEYAKRSVTKKNILQAKKAYKRAVEILKSRTELDKQEKSLLRVSLYNYAALMKDIDSNTTYIYMLQAAERGYSPAMRALAGYYLSFKTPDALAKAFFWIKKAQELNDPKAQTLFEAATKRVQESEDASKDDKNLVECVESLEQPKVEDSLEFDSSSAALEVVDSPASVSASPQESSSSSDSSDEEIITADDYTITPQEIDQWKEEQAKWKQDIKNPKFVREKLREAHQSFQNKQEVQERPTLSSSAEKIIKTLGDKETRNQITIDNLFSLFEDPYFQGQVDMFKTTDGYAIVSYNFFSGKTKTTTGTHRKHNKSYKGLDPNFLKSVAELVEEFKPPLSDQG